MMKIDYFINKCTFVLIFGINFFTEESFARFNGFAKYFHSIFFTRCIYNTCMRTTNN